MSLNSKKKCVSYMYNEIVQKITMVDVENSMVGSLTLMLKRLYQRTSPHNTVRRQCAIAWTWENLICDNFDTFNVHFSAQDPFHHVQFT